MHPGGVVREHEPRVTADVGDQQEHLGFQRRVHDGPSVSTRMPRAVAAIAITAMSRLPALLRGMTERWGERFAERETDCGIATARPRLRTSPRAATP